MKKCMYCHAPIVVDKSYHHKVGYFCCEAHFDAYCKNLSNEELAYLMHSICPCSDEGE
nr:hypothetical protein [uncultured Cellulosilyticum sp.]